MADITAVCFDLDDTLCISEQDPDRLLGAAFEEVGVERLFSAADLDAVDVGALPTAHTDREFFEHFFRAGTRVVGADPESGTVEAVAAAYVERLDPAAVTFREGARRALAAARERYPVALVTNGSEATQTAKLDELGVVDAFDAVVYCDPAAGIEPKPDPGPLERALSELGVPAERALLVGDSLAADVAGACAVGMRSAWVPREAPTPNPRPTPDHVLDSVGDVVDLL